MYSYFINERMQKVKILFLLIGVVLLSWSCEDSDNQLEQPYLLVKFDFDPNQVRLNNLGQPAEIPAENAAQTPLFKKISAHYLEFSQNAYTPLGEGAIVYHADETASGGSLAIDFKKAILVEEGQTFLKIPLHQIPQGNYEYVRVSLAYQEYEISVKNANNDYLGTLASFVGYNNYIETHYIGNNSFPVNGNREQGYWAFALHEFPYATSGQAPAGATTVPNPLATTSPIPQGSCVVTGKFSNPLIIRSNENKNIEVTLSLSINNSFEWQEVNFDGKYEPAAGEQVVDMGLRGLIPSYLKK